jgi:hypothetical protein
LTFADIRVDTIVKTLTAQGVYASAKNVVRFIVTTAGLLGPNQAELVKDIIDVPSCRAGLMAVVLGVVKVLSHPL